MPVDRDICDSSYSGEEKSALEKKVFFSNSDSVDQVQCEHRIAEQLDLISLLMSMSLHSPCHLSCPS